jgi:hypothetical protein
MLMTIGMAVEATVTHLQPHPVLGQRSTGIVFAFLANKAPLLSAGCGASLAFGFYNKQGGTLSSRSTDCCLQHNLDCLLFQNFLYFL